MGNTLISKAREALGTIWRRANLKGTCWTPKLINNQVNPSGGISLVLEEKGELVAIAQCGNTFITREFLEVKNTKLGREVRKILQEILDKSVALKKDEIMALIDKDIIWCCWECGKQGGVDDANDPYVNIRNIKNDHQRISPDCHPPISRFKVYVARDGRLEELIELHEILSLELVK